MRDALLGDKEERTPHDLVLSNMEIGLVCIATFCPCDLESCYKFLNIFVSCSFFAYYFFFATYLAIGFFFFKQFHYFTVLFEVIIFYGYIIRLNEI